ncbi:MAG: hypothetical protein M1820_007393 [Bogoriella megaspora]|nr:MAG: hypothetical protein M1820_007393 [Bogoriella megaspora]
MDTERLNSLKGSEPTKSIREASQALKDDVKRDLTLLWHQLPAWQQDNHYIVSGYRPASGSYLVSLRSLGYIHNETINIYTHLLGALLAATMAVWLFSALGKRYYLADSDDMIVLICFFIGAVACLGMSATYHLISNHSETVAVFGNKLDYLGIVALIWGSFVPCIYYGFRDNISLMKLYWTMVRNAAEHNWVQSIKG